MKTKKFQLKNGLNVLMCESHRAPVVSVQMWVRTGSADEAKSEQGISHFIEHLVFKGTRNFKVGEIAKTVESHGGELNAYTSFDQTVFYITISKEFLEIAFRGISEMMGFPTFDPVEIDNEREVVIEEIKRGKDSPGRQASEQLFSSAYSKHPYRIPVIGYEANIKKWSAKKIVSYFHERYAPRNMFLVVAGDVTEKEDREKVQKLFGEFRDYPVKKVKRPKEPKQTAPRIKVKKTNFQQNSTYLAWKIPSIMHKDIPALDVLAIVLGQGDSSRLVSKLRLDQPIVNSIGASAYSPLDPGLFTISMTYPTSNFSRAMDGIKEELSRVLNEPIRDEEVRSAVINLESERFYSQETADGLARTVGSLEFYFRDQNQEKEYLRQIRSLTPKDLHRVAKKYLVYKTLTVSVSTQDEEAGVKKILQTWMRDWRRETAGAKSRVGSASKIRHGRIAPLSSSAERPETTKLTLSNGIRVLLRPDRDTEVISIKAAFLGGARMEKENQEGLNELLGRAWLGGTKSRSEAVLLQEIERIASSISPVAGKHSLGLGLDTLTLFESKARELFLDVLGNPTFPHETVEREKGIQLEHIKLKRDNPAQACMRLFARKAFPSHPYSRDPLGAEQSLSELGRQQVIELWNEVAKKRNLNIILCGNFDKKSWIEELEKYSELSSGSAIAIGAKPLPIVSENLRGYEHSSKEQSHVVYGFRGFSMSDPDRYVLQIIQSILAGQGGRLFLELRDKNSLAYTVSPLHMEGLDTGYFGAYIGCSPEKMEKAITMMREQFDRLCDEGVSEEEISRAKQYIIGRHDIDLQRTNQVAAAILYNDIYGIDYHEPFLLADKFRDIKSADIQRVARRIFRQKSIIAVVGPRDLNEM